MALRQILLGRERAALVIERSALSEAENQIRARREAWQAREAQAEAALTEMTDETPEADRAAFDTECAEIERENQAITAEEDANSTRAAEIDARVAEIDAELERHNRSARDAGRSGARAGSENNNTNNNHQEREGIRVMYTAAEERRERVRTMVRESEEVRSFLGRVREMRGVTNVDVTVPMVMLPMLQEAETRYSKLSPFVSTASVRGESRMNIMGSAPEAVWTETTGAFNEMNLAMAQIPMDGNKLGGYVVVPNAYLEDSDENLAGAVVESIGQSLGYAKDKAILYGTGSNMPVGIVTRLAASAQPSWWGAKQGTFTALNTTHIGKLSATSVTGVKLYAELAKVLGMAKEKVRNGESGKFWAMNSATRLKLMTELMGTNAAGALVSSLSDELPIIGGKCVVLDFIPAGDIVGGYGSQYKYVTRRSVIMRTLAELRALQDETVFLGSERADGKPIAGEGFAAFNISAQNVTTSLDFAADTANSASSDTE